MKAKISSQQYFFILPNLFYAKAIGITAGVIVREVGSDVWTSMLIGFIVGTAVVLLTVALAARHPDKTIFEYSEELVGPIASKIIGILLAVYFAVAYAVSANVMNLHLKEYFLPQTPFIILCIAWTLLIFYGVRLGIEVVIRFSLFGFFMLWLINITMILGTLKDFKFMNLLPIVDRGIVENFKGSIFLFSDIAMVILAVGIIFPMVSKKEKIMPITFFSMVVGIISVIIWPFFEVGVLGSDVMKQFVVVCMQQVRSAQLTRYLPRYELIMTSFFVWSLVVQSSLMMYCSLHSIKQVTKIKKDTWILIPLTAVLIIITFYLGKDHNYYIQFLAKPWSQISAALSCGLPILLLAVSLLRGKKKRTA